MRGREWLALVALTVAAGTRSAVPLAAFGHLPSVDLITVSPDGSWRTFSRSTRRSPMGSDGHRQRCSSRSAATTRVDMPQFRGSDGFEDRWLSRSATRAAMLDATAAFLARHLPADAAAAAATPARAAP